MFLCVFYLLLALFLYGVFYYFTNDTLNPFSLSLLCWLGCFSFSLLYLNDYVSEFKFITHVVVLVVTFDITLAGLLTVFDKRRLLRYSGTGAEKVYVNRTFKMLCWLFVIGSALCVMYLLASNGFGLRSFGNYSSFDKKADVQVLYESSAAAYGAQFFPYTPILMVYLLLYDRRKTRIEKLMYWIVIVVVCLYDWVIIVSRGTLLIALLGIGYLINTKYRIRFKTLVILGVVLIAVFGVLMTHRVDSASIVFAGTTGNAIINSTYNYLAFCYVNLEKLLVHGSPYTIITRTWTTISRLLGIWDESKLINYKTLMNNATSFAYPFYHDLGMVGVIIYPVVTYLVLGKIYVDSRLRKREYSLIIATLMKAICVLTFGNYFFGILVNDINYLIMFFIVILAYGWNRTVFTIRKLELV